MVAPNRDLRNIHFSTLAFLSTALQMDCLPADSAIDINDYKNIKNYDEGRERTSSLLSKVSSRSTFVSLKATSIKYHIRMEIQNKLPDKEFMEPINNPQLLYDNNSTKTPYDNKIIGQNSPWGPQHVLNKALTLNSSTTPHVDNDNVINI